MCIIKGFPSQEVVSNKVYQDQVTCVDTAFSGKAEDNDFVAPLFYYIEYECGRNQQWLLICALSLGVECITSYHLNHYLVLD